jgi:hypothetical protein
MSALDDKIESIQTLLSSLTWGRIAMLATFLVVVGFSYAMFDNRFAVYEYIGNVKTIPPAKSIKISKETRDAIDGVVAGSELINAIQITLVDFQRNTRTIVFTKIDDPRLAELYKKFEDRSPTELPLFNTDIINNQRLVNLVNGDFICNPYKDTIGAKLIPETTQYIHTVCAGPVPPFYGRFSGIISIYLTKQPSPVESEQIKVLSRNLGLSIYNNDFR